MTHSSRSWGLCSSDTEVLYVIIHRSMLDMPACIAT